MTTTVIKGADWVIAWDAAAGRHTYQRGADVAFAETGSRTSARTTPARRT